MSKPTLTFLQWLRLKYCFLCGGFDDWNGNDDLPLCTVSHVRTRGSGGTDMDNCLPMCTKCHRDFEEWSWEEKQKLLRYAVQYTESYFEYKHDKIGTY